LRIFCAIYGATLLELFLRLQVNLVGRYLYLDSVSNSPETGSVNLGEFTPFGTETQKSYIAHADHLVHTGLPEFVEFIRGRVREVVSTWPLQRQCSYEDLLRLFLEVRRSVEQIPAQKDAQTVGLLYYLLPPERKGVVSESNGDIEEEVLGAYGEGDDHLKMLLNETRNILESDAFSQVLKPSLNLAFLVLYKNLRSAFLRPNISPSDVRTPTTMHNDPNPNQPASKDLSSDMAPIPQTPTDSPLSIDATQFPPPLPSLISHPMAKLLPSINKQLPLLLNHTHNEVISAISDTSQLHDFCYTIFTTSAKGK